MISFYLFIYELIKLYYKLMDVVMHDARLIFILFLLILNVYEYKSQDDDKTSINICI